MRAFQTLLVFAALATSAVLADGGNQQQQQRPTPKSAPTVTLKNGSYFGVYDAAHKEDIFYSIPFAQAPVGNLRFQNPQPLNTSWSTPRNATVPQLSCYTYMEPSSSENRHMTEDCLRLTVVRPSGVAKGAKLPVAVWIHGGAYSLGDGVLDQLEGITSMVQLGAQTNKPFISVIVNYRLNGLGFLWGSAVKAAGVANLGLKDQRLSLHWVQENIAQFGGDPKKVTIFGESAGGDSVANQLMAYGGRDEGLFRAAVMESAWKVGMSTSDLPTAEQFDVEYNRITAAAGCNTTKDTLACLRQVPMAKLDSILNDSRALFYPSIDGDFIPESNAMLLKKGKFVRVPIINGANEAEGTLFNRLGVNTEQDFLDFVKQGSPAVLYIAGHSEAEAKTIAKLYPDIPDQGVPVGLRSRPENGSSLGSMYKRSCAYGGDTAIHAARRYTSQMFAKHNVPVYDFFFNTVPSQSTVFMGASHGFELAFVMHTQTGTPEIEGVATMMSRMWISFFTDLTPNHSGVTDVEWPKYTLKNPKSIAFDANVTKMAYVMPDTFREKGIAYLQSLFN